MLGIRENIKKWFVEAVRMEVTAPQDLRDALLREPPHARVEIFVDNMCAEFEKADKLLQGKGRVVKLKTFQDTTYDMTKVFMQRMKADADQRHESDLAKAARKAEADKIKEFEDVLAGRASGEFLEAGVITNEKIDKEGEDFREYQDRLTKKEN